MLNKITIYSILTILMFNAAAIAAEWTETSFKDFADGTYSDGGANIYTTADGTIKIIGQQLDVNGDGYRVKIPLLRGATSSEQDVKFIS